MVQIEQLAGTQWEAAGELHSDVASMPEGFTALRWTDRANAVFHPAWMQLARAAASPNPFFEPWFCLPALRQFDPEGEVRLAMLGQGGKAVGLIPLRHNPSYHGYPLPHVAGWGHHNAFLGEPLIAEGCEKAFWGALFEWCDGHARASLFLHLPAIPTDGSAFSALEQVCSETGRPITIVHREYRALLERGLSSAGHLEASLTKKRRKELARKRRRLEDLGHLRFVRLTDARDLDAWTDDFIGLEKAGWKGANGSALGCDPRTEALFREALRGSAAEKRLERLAFYLDGRPVAMLCNFITPPGSFSFKTAFDESLSKLSPGVLLQVENLAILEREDIAWSDSCAAPDHPMIDHIWRDRREIVQVSIAIGGRLRRAVGSALSAIEARRFRRSA